MLSLQFVSLYSPFIIRNWPVLYCFILLLLHYTSCSRGYCCWHTLRV